MAESIRSLFQRRLKLYSNPNADRYDPAKDKDRRKKRIDRRQCQTYLACDVAAVSLIVASDCRAFSIWPPSAQRDVTG